MKSPLLAKNGVSSVILHRIRAFCPSVAALDEASKKISKNDRPSTRRSNGVPAAQIVGCKLAQRPMFDVEHHRWRIEDGFAPSLTVQNPTVATLLHHDGQTPFAVRLLRQGIGVFAQAVRVEAENQLVEPEPSSDDPPQEVMRKGLADFQAQLGMNKNPRDFLEEMRLETQIDVYGQQQYEVVELVFRDQDALHRLSDVHDGQDVDRDFTRFILYCLARSYALNGNKKTDALHKVINEINPAAYGHCFVDVGFFDSDPPAAGTIANRRRLVNHAQTKRAFVALGARGAVLAHMAGKYNHPYLCAAVLNLIDILRGRYHNLILARTVADTVIRKLIQKIATNDLESSPSGIGLLQDIGEANYLYGLVVSDPSVYLLDGSTLTRLVEEADTAFQLRSLREDTERKMSALQRLWQTYQDKTRSEIVKSLWSEV